MSKRKTLQTLDYFLKSLTNSEQSDAEIQTDLATHESQSSSPRQQIMPSCSNFNRPIQNTVLLSSSSISVPENKMDTQYVHPQLPHKLADTGPINDISRFCNRVLSHAEKINVLNNVWIPSATYVFPVILSGPNKKKLKFQHTWLSKWNWLAYSEIENGCYCKYCVVFSKAGAGVNAQSLGALTKNKFDNWKKAIGVFEKHSLAQYHLRSLSDADNFLKVDRNNLLSIENKLSADRTAKILKNRQKIIPIIEAVILCGIQEIALRGHRDSGKITTDDGDKGEGNFRAILRYRAKGDEILKAALEGPGERNKYISPSIQNEIINSCNSLILEKVVSEVNTSKCFSVLADETADISGVEQVSLCVRYVDMTSIKIKEHFLQFVQTADLTGSGLAAIIMDNLRKWGIDTKYLKGQEYDGAAAMSGKFNGVQTHIKREYPTALYVHCAAHSLNLAVSKASEVSEIRNCLGTVGQAHNFFIYPKRKDVLNRVLAEAETTPKTKTLKGMCATRWIERFESISDFKEIYLYVVDALSEIAEWADRDTAKEARSLMNSIAQGNFITTLFVTNTKLLC
ncbi:zinc finger MYM-type protein 1-like [Anoplophora glabripennis]|uniref:zinc finger MYM-type protein 1-like n=1 Tax=Anoplophora glabripennis TaxID=217634 RepID=UPI000C771F4C|nr:zinc finger MYM-type protein 1-like [Anoplophora glabripennis]